MRNISNSDISADGEKLRTLMQELGRRRPLRDPVTSLLEELKFTPAQCHTLLWLGLERGLTMGEIAGRLGITEKTVTGVIDRLEADGFVSRIRSAEDRRVVRVRLTRKGSGIYRGFERLLRARVDGLMRLLEPAERQALIRIFEKILERLPPRPT
jgi:DNA-binding MarR family transcriptional regulator